MKISAVDSKIESVKSDVLVLGFFAKDKSVLKKLKADFDFDEFRKWRLVSSGDFSAKNVLVVCLGEKDKCDLDSLRKVAGFCTKLVRDKLDFNSFATNLHELDVPDTSLKERVQAVTEGVLLGNYRFDKYKTLDKDKRKELSEIIILTKEKAVVENAKILAENVLLCRDLQNEPPSSLIPEVLAEEALKCKKLGVKVTVFDKKQIEKLGMNALLAVNSGSVNEPRFVIMEYNGGGKKKVALVGKGITFDSGGLDIKPADAMLAMKMDMSGAAVVLSAVRAAAMLKLPVNLVGVFAATENMPGQNAYKQGDIIKAYNDKTIEVMNTDAEGRVILADALSYTEKVIKPDAIVDIATLTGACMVALGSVCAGVMSREEGGKIVEQLEKSGYATYERVWRFPFWKEYHDQVKADFADVRNIGSVPKEAGAITAGTFLSAFVEKTPWAHIDIAGPAWAEKADAYLSKGGTGFGVRLLVHFLENFR